MKELGYCSGIENYSRYFDRRQPGQRPFCLMDYFPKDYLFVIDESHVTVSQVSAMYGGDRSRKGNLVEYGFRLTSAMDNRPLTSAEWEGMQRQTIFVSATPADYELQKSEGVYVEQIIRPTGLLDPIIEIRPSLNQIDDLIEEIQQRCELDERTLVTTLTKRMAEELTKYLTKVSIRCRYIHSDVDTLERVEIMQDLRKGLFDVLIGVNLLREGLDLPEVSLVAILDADKEGFLRSERSLIQTIGRAARNLNGKAILYADRMTDSMKKAIGETERRRAKQIAFNEANGITPRGVVKQVRDLVDGVYSEKAGKGAQEREIQNAKIEDMSERDVAKEIKRLEKLMMEHARNLEFENAARVRDQLAALREQAFGGAGHDRV